MVKTDYKHITIHETKGAMIAGTRIKVIHLVNAQTTNDWSPTELVMQFPPITLSQVYSALAYYWDHKDELDEQNKSELEVADKLWRASRDDPFVKRLREQRQKSL